ncbi:hypothetical protein [Nocardia sp. NPDC051981]|uniref:hypothetical protein n=1 Tax=Nocardia sp. NPDC051981 TaxID=3155417 RepID=UPI003443BF52
MPAPRAVRFGRVRGRDRQTRSTTYRAGLSQAWRKLPLRRSAEVVVVGWLAGHTHSEVFGSLLVAAHDHGWRR